MGLTLTKSYEDLLADAIEATMATAGDDIERLAAALNERSVHGPNGELWTAELLAAELKRLGA